MAGELYSRLAAELEKIPAIDAHSRIRADEPSSSNAAEAFFHPEIKSALIAAGLNGKIFEGDFSAEEQLQKALRYLPHIKNTSAYRSATRMLKDLFDIETIDESIASKKPPNASKVLEDANVERVIGFVNWWKSASEADDIPVASGLRLDSLINEPHLPRTMDRLGEVSGESIYDASELRTAVRRVVSAAANSGCRALSASFNPRVTFDQSSRDAADRVLSLVMLGQKTSIDDRKSLRSFVMSCVLEAAGENELPVQLFLGVVQTTSTGVALPGLDPELLRGYVGLFADYPSVTFDVILANAVQSQELAAIALNFPNVHASGCWSYASQPMQMGRMLRERIEMLPITKSCALTSMSPNVEWLNSTTKGLRHSLAVTLVGLIEEGQISEESALEVGRYYLRENALRLYFAPRTPKL